jgi:hypothetical protein
MLKARMQREKTKENVKTAGRWRRIMTERQLEATNRTFSAHRDSARRGMAQRGCL